MNRPASVPWEARDACESTLTASTTTHGCGTYSKSLHTRHVNVKAWSYTGYARGACTLSQSVNYSQWQQQTFSKSPSSETLLSSQLTSSNTSHSQVSNYTAWWTEVNIQSRVGETKGTWPVKRTRYWYVDDGDLTAALLCHFSLPSLAAANSRTVWHSATGLRRVSWLAKQVPLLPASLRTPRWRVEVD